MTASRALLVLHRAMKERLLASDFGNAQRRQAVEYFEQAGIPGCIYCGSDRVERWDHLVPVHAGGATVLGNMVQACQPCDDSKAHRDYRDWLASGIRKNPARGDPAAAAAVIAKVEAYQRRFAYTPPADFRAALSSTQLQQYEAFLLAVREFEARLAQFGLVIRRSGAE